MKQLQVENLKTLPYSAEEALNRLRVNFGFCGNQFKKVIITSSMPDEGKSAVAANLWRMLAEAGKKVVLVDADIRKSVLRSRHRITNSNTDTGVAPAPAAAESSGHHHHHSHGKGENLPGLSLYLSGQCDKEDVLYSTNIGNAYMVPVFYTIANPAILFQSPRFRELLDWLSESFDYVLVDTPPLSNVADGDLIASQCDGALLVVRGSFTPRGMISNSIKQLERANCKLMGVVLNRVTTEKNGYYYRYSKYGYYSNYGYGKTSTAEADQSEKQ